MFSQRVRTTLRLALITFLIASTFLGPASFGDASSQSDAGSRSPSPVSQAPTDTNILVIPPVSQGFPKVDGFCDEYPGLGAAVRTFSDSGGTIGKIYFIYSADLLYVCMKSTQGTYQDRFGRLYLDPHADGSGYVYADNEDLAFQVKIPGTARLATGETAAQMAGQLILPWMAVGMA